jgi:hypothetical protein
LKREDEILFSERILLGRIHLVGQKASLESVHDYRTVLSILLHCYKLCNNLKAATLVLVHRFCRILFYDRFALEDLIYTSELELMERIMGAIVLLGEEICPEEVIDEELVALKERFPIKKWWARSWVSGACDTIKNQRFYVTDSGLMGLGPSSLESGDMICVLLGCWVPVVLRPIDTNYDEEEREELVDLFRQTVGSIVILSDTLSTTALTSLLNLPMTDVDEILKLVQAVLDVPDSLDLPVRLLHLSFRDFLLDKSRCSDIHFWVDERQAHQTLADDKVSS